jgi:DNA-binding NarL/FixJ family response regulator
MRIIIADQHASARTALRLFLQEQEHIEVIYEARRVGELLRDAPGYAPDIVFLNWGLPGFKGQRLASKTGETPPQRTLNQIKAVVIAALHYLPSRPAVVVIGNQPDERLPALVSGADDFLYQGEVAHLLALLKSIQSRLAQS